MESLSARFWVQQLCRLALDDTDDTRCRTHCIEAAARRPAKTQQSQEALGLGQQVVRSTEREMRRMYVHGDAMQLVSGWRPVYFVALPSPAGVA
eukprot:5631251-Prymnesium_polylepis.1